MSPRPPGSRPPAAAPEGPTSDERDDAGEPTEDDRLLAQALDLGWERLGQGDTDGARAAATRALSLAADSPEAVTLLGAAAAADGHIEEALGHFDRAVELDPDYVEPYLNAAELHLYPIGDPEEAVDLCDRALEIAEEEDEFLDALLLKAEAQLELDDPRAARRTLSELPPTRFPDAQLHLRAGRALLDAEDLSAAERHLRLALEIDPALSDALHGLGLLHEARGDMKSMVQTFRAVRDRDLAEPAPPWGVTAARFEEIAHEALAELPQALRDRLENVPILAADYPAIELVAEGNDPRMMGYFSGVPLPEKSALGATPHLDCVFLYQRNIERACRSQAEVVEEIRRTLIDETGHFFGLSEEELDDLGLA